MYERLREAQPRKPIAEGNFYDMLSCMFQAERLGSVKDGRKARRESVKLAAEILRAPQQELIGVTEAFAILAINRALAARVAYKTLLAAKVLRAAQLRALLGLQPHGPILGKK
jgi:hypothetical protein